MKRVALARSLNASLQAIKIAMMQSLGRLALIICFTYRLIFSTRPKSELLRVAIILDCRNCDILFDNFFGSTSAS